MKLNTLFTIWAVIAFVYGAASVLLPGFMIQLLFLNPAGPEGHILIQGCGSALLGFTVIAWGARSFESDDARRVVGLGFFTYFVVTTILWLIDALSRGWTIFSVITFALLVLFSLGFGYFTLLRRPSAQPVMQ